MCVGDDGFSRSSRILQGSRASVANVELKSGSMSNRRIKAASSSLNARRWSRAVESGGKEAFHGFVIWPMDARADFHSRFGP